jgi:hypothetical protein
MILQALRSSPFYENEFRNRFFLLPLHSYVFYDDQVGQHTTGQPESIDNTIEISELNGRYKIQRIRAINHILLYKIMAKYHYLVS